MRHDTVADLPEPERQVAHFRVAPTPAAPTPIAPAPAAAAEPGPELDPELGPEPTHIGAMPLISFGDTPLVSKIGENQRRPPAQLLPPPSATFLPEAVDMPRGRRNKLIAIIAIAVAIVVVVIVLVAR